MTIRQFHPDGKLVIILVLIPAMVTSSLAVTSSWAAHGEKAKAHNYD